MLVRGGDPPEPPAWLAVFLRLLADGLVLWGPGFSCLCYLSRFFLPLPVLPGSWWFSVWGLVFGVLGGFLSWFVISRGLDLLGDDYYGAAGVAGQPAGDRAGDAVPELGGGADDQGVGAEFFSGGG